MAYEKEITTSTDDELGTASFEAMTDSLETKNHETRPIFEPSECYNGACFHNYAWSQSIGEIGMLSHNCTYMS